MSMFLAVTGNAADQNGNVVVVPMNVDVEVMIILTVIGWTTSDKFF